MDGVLGVLSFICFLQMWGKEMNIIWGKNAFSCPFTKKFKCQFLKLYLGKLMKICEVRLVSSSTFLVEN